MTSYTSNLGLLKKDPLADANDTFNIKTMLNDNWDKIDDAIGDIPGQVSELAEVSLTYKELPAGMTSLHDLVEKGVYFVPNVGAYAGKPAHPTDSSVTWSGNSAIINVYDVRPPSTQATVLRSKEAYIQRGSEQYYYKQNTVVSGTGTSMSITNYAWERVFTGSGGTITGALTINSTLTVGGRITGGSGGFAGTVDVTSAYPLIFKHPTSTTTRRWVTHIESGSAGYLHLSPEKADASAGFDFDKGLRIDGATGDLLVKNGITDKLWVNPQRSSGVAPRRTLTLGDPTDGLSWNRLGNLELWAKDEIMWYTLNEGNEKGLYVFSPDRNERYNVATEIYYLKQSGVNAKQGLVDAISAKSGSASTSETFAALTAKLKTQRKIVTGGLSYGASANDGTWLTFSAANQYADHSIGINFDPDAFDLKIWNFRVNGSGNTSILYSTIATRYQEFYYASPNGNGSVRVGISFPSTGVMRLTCLAISGYNSISIKPHEWTAVY